MIEITFIKEKIVELISYIKKIELYIFQNKKNDF